MYFNSVPSDKILSWSKFKAFADDKANVAQIIISVFDKVENIVGKGENASYQHFLLFPRYFQTASYSGCKKSGLCDRELSQAFRKRSFSGLYSVLSRSLVRSPARPILIVIATGFIPLSSLSVVSTMVMWESSQWLGKNIMRNNSSVNSRKAWLGALAAAI